MQPWEPGNIEERGGIGPGAELTSALWSVKSLVSIVMGLALTHTIVTLLTTEQSEESTRHVPGAVLSVSEIKPAAALSALALITAIIRFYHGNNQFLDLLYGAGGPGRHAADTAVGIGGNFIVIMIQSAFFALMSFYVNGSRQLMLLFMLLLVFDILWAVGNLQADADPRAMQTQRNWMRNNIVFTLVLFGFYYTKNDSWAVTGAAGAILLNTIVDFKISWRTYFPPPA